jgi:succinate-acetate transporter protein
MVSQPTSATTAHPNGGAALAETVLSGPEHGRGYFYPATAGGTPLALMAFASTLGLLSMANAEWFDVRALVIVAPAALGFGAVAMILAGMWDFRAGNGFGATWETSYGCFWLFLGLQLAIFSPKVLAAAGAAGATHAFGAYLLVWALITAGFTAGTWFVARTAFVAFALLVVALVCLGVANVISSASTSDALREIGGWIGIVDALVGFYLAFALMMNALLGRALVPIGLYQPGK